MPASTRISYASLSKIGSKKATFKEEPVQEHRQLPRVLLHFPNFLYYVLCCGGTSLHGRNVLLQMPLGSRITSIIKTGKKERKKETCKQQPVRYHKPRTPRHHYQFECTKRTGIRSTGSLAGEILRVLYRGPERKASLRTNCTPWPNPSTHVSSSSSHSHRDHDNRSHKSATPSESLQIEQLVVSRIDQSAHQGSHQLSSASQQASRRHAAKASNSISIKSRS